LWFGIPLAFWPVGDWIIGGDESFDLKCGNQWLVEIYYRPDDTPLTCEQVAEQIPFTFTGTPPENYTETVTILPIASCRQSAFEQTAVVRDGSDSDKALKPEDLTEVGKLSYYLDGTKADGCWQGGVYRIESPVKLWVKENKFTSGFNSMVQSAGITVFFGCAFLSWGVCGCLAVFVCLLSEDPALRAVQPPPSQMQMQMQQ